MGDNFGIGFGLEFDAFGLEFLLQDGVVFDNAVMDNRNLAVKALVRVRVLFGGGAVGSPTGVGDTDMAMKWLLYWAYRAGLIGGRRD